MSGLWPRWTTWKRCGSLCRRLKKTQTRQAPDDRRSGGRSWAAMNLEPRLCQVFEFSFKSSLKMIVQFFFMSFQKAVGSCIYELRERAGFTVQQLAESSGISISRLIAIERGEIDIKLGTLLLLALSLDITLPELLGYIAGKLGGPKATTKGRLIVFPKLSKAQSKP